MEVILAAGSWITPLLQKSCIEAPPAPRIPKVTGILALFLHLNKEQREIYRCLPPLSEIGKGTFLLRDSSKIADNTS